jgi:predicted O-linked N-acetylglucosamine transferase (SPINDLY family)
MIEETYLLAHSRLAPIQINTIGHSETSGINTIDYYVSSILYDDLEESQSHYSEKLILTNSLNTFYYRDFYDIYQNSGVQKDYVLPLSPDKIYLSYLQNSLKADVEDLQLLYQLLEKIPSVNIVLINLIENSLEDLKLKTHLKPFFDQNRVILLPKLSTNHFYTLIQKSYLILDAYPHGGCNTSLETFHFGKMMISRPSPYLRGRFTKGFYQKMGISDCIVKTPDEYIEKVQYFVNHPDKKIEVEEKIQKQSHLLFHDYQSVVDWNNIFLQLHQK